MSRLKTVSQIVETGVYPSRRPGSACVGLVALNVPTRLVPRNQRLWHCSCRDAFRSATRTYYDYPTSANSVPNSSSPAQDTGNSANFYDNGYTNESVPLTRMLEPTRFRQVDTEPSITAAMLRNGMILSSQTHSSI